MCNEEKNYECTENNSTDKLVNKIIDLIDIRKILKNGEILIEPVQGGL